MLRMWLCAALAALSIISSAARAQSNDLQRLSNDVVPTAYDLAVAIDPREDRFSGEARISLTLAKPTTEFAINGRDLRVTKASLTPEGGGALTAAFREDPNNPGWARIALGGTAPAGKAVLTIVYDAPFAERSGLYRKKSDDGTSYVFSQMEPVDARRAFPSFDDPRFKTPYTVAVTARAGDVVVTNGPLLRTEQLRGGRARHVFAPTEPLPTYLIAFAVGPFDVVEAKPLPKTGIRAREVPLRGIALKGKGVHFETALRSTRAFVEWLEDYFAAPYPFAKLDLIAVPQMPGAMENAGAITYGEIYILLSPQASKSQLRAFAEIHAHELAHQWLGNLVTLAWWDDLWLNESFATWMSYRAAAAVMPELGIDRTPRTVTNTSLAHDALRNVKAIRRPLRTENDIRGAFDYATYYKGAAVIAMVEDFLGRDRFRDGLRAYVRRLPHATTTSKELFAALEETTGDRQIGAAFESFLAQSHAPVVTGALSCRGAPRHSVSQGTYSPLGWSLPQQRWTIPLCTKAYGAAGAADRACTTITERETALPLAGKACPQFVSSNGGFGHFHQANDADGWKALEAQLNRLAPDEQIAAIEGARSAFAANAMPPATFLDLLGKAAASADARLLATAVDQVELLATTVPAGAAAPYHAWVRATLADTLAAAAKQTAEPELTLALLRVLAINGRDPALRARLGETGRSMMNVFQLQIARPALPRDLAFRVAVEDGGSDVFATLLTAAKASNQRPFRWDALRALGRAPRSEDRAAFTVALKDFEHFEVILVLFDLADDPATATFAWETTKTQFERLLARDAAVGQHVAVFARGLCSAEGRADLAAFVAANKAKLKNHEATMALTIDAIDHCVALRGVQGQPLAAALKARAAKVAARRIGEKQDAAALVFEQLSLAPGEQDATFGEVVATCGGKFPSASPLAICASARAPKACRDIRLMTEQCMGR